jgi:hypothetical protein
MFCQEGALNLAVESAGTTVDLRVETNNILPNVSCAGSPLTVIAEEVARVDDVACMKEVGSGAVLGGIGPLGPRAEDWASDLGPPFVGGVANTGPHLLRTKYGDLPIQSPTYSNPFIGGHGGVDSNVAIAKISSAPQLDSPAICNDSNQDRVRSKYSVAKKHHKCPMANLPLPPSKLLKFSRLIPGQPSTLKRRKHPPKGNNTVQKVVEVALDTIHCSDEVSIEVVGPTQESTVHDLGGISLEVVFPFYGENSGRVLGSGSAVNPFAVSMQDPSGVLSMCNGGDILNGDEDSAGRGFVSRDVLEASKIMQI